jgi:fructuronate reductase/mannitol 2-dehydrogenase
VRVPTYDRGALRPGVVHLGVGGFHRSHQATYFDDLAEGGVTTDWGIVGVGMRRPRMKEALEPQDCLYTVVERDEGGSSARIVGVMPRYLCAPQEPEAVLAALTDRQTRVVMLTVTGDGYHVNADTGELDADGEAVRADLDNPSRPTTPTGYIVEALARRRAAGVPPFTVMSCDNIPRNGDVARTALVGFGTLRDELLGRWIEKMVACPSSMVDRITPETTDADRAAIRREFGVDDRWPVVTEPFRQWIVEDEFCDVRPPLEEAGVQFVGDVGPYQLMKTRLLNASHSAIGYLGALAGHERTDDAMADPVLCAYVTDLMAKEVAPLLPATPGVDHGEYRRTLLRRFANPSIGDPLARLCGRGSTKMPAYLLPSIADAQKRGRSHPLLTLAVAAWLRYLRGTDCEGRPIEIKDAFKDELQRLAREGGADPRPMLGRRDIFGDLGLNQDFVAAVGRDLVTLDRHGVHAAVAGRLGARVARAA